jgi:hypothetical protein
MLPHDEQAGPIPALAHAMNLYSTIVSLHVITAILGLGPLALLAAVVTRAPAGGLPLDRGLNMMRWIGWSLAGMFATGAAIIALTHGALGETRWMRVSFALFVVLGALHGLARRRLKRALEAENRAAAEIARLGPLLWTMCALVAAITYLMEAKPW